MPTQEQIKQAFEIVRELSGLQSKIADSLYDEYFADGQCFSSRCGFCNAESVNRAGIVHASDCIIQRAQLLIESIDTPPIEFGIVV